MMDRKFQEFMEMIVYDQFRKKKLNIGALGVPNFKFWIKGKKQRFYDELFYRS